MAVSVNCLFGSTIAVAAGLPPWTGMVALNALGVVGSLAPQGVLKAGIYTEVWTGYMIKALRDEASKLGWYSKIRNFNQYVKNDAIHMNDIGLDPDVLINNTTYPLDVQALPDSDKAFSLDKFQTKPTPVTDDELYALSYDKMSSVIERHRDALEINIYTKAIHSLAPAANTANTPVLLTTGDNDSGNTRRKITRQDIIRLKKSFDVQKVPVTGRILVLCSDHVNDLLESDQKFADQYYNYTTGKISNLYGFEVYEYNECPYYNTSDLTKISFGGSTIGYMQASVAFYAPRMMKADGSTKTYMSQASADPLYQRNLVAFRTYNICLPLKNECIGAIVSAPAADATPSIVVEPAEIEFTNAGGSQVVEVGCASNYVASITGTGFSKSKSGGTVTVTATANNTEGDTARTGTLTLKDLATGDTVTVPISQAGA